QVGPADRGARDLHDRITRVEDLRIRNVFDPQLLRAVPAVRLHERTPTSERSFRGSDGCAARQSAGPSEIGISPVSMSCLKRRRSSLIWISGSSPKSQARLRPSGPAGGVY